MSTLWYQAMKPEFEKYVTEVEKRMRAAGIGESAVAGWRKIQEDLDREQEAAQAEFDKSHVVLDPDEIFWNIDPHPVEDSPNGRYMELRWGWTTSDEVPEDVADDAPTGYDHVRLLPDQAAELAERLLGWLKQGKSDEKYDFVETLYGILERTGSEQKVITEVSRSEGVVSVCDGKGRPWSLIVVERPWNP